MMKFKCDNPDHKHEPFDINLEKGRVVTLEQFAAIVVKAFKNIFDRSFVATVSKTEDGKLHITAKEQDAGQAIMSVSDVAAYLGCDKGDVRALTGARAQQRSTNPIKFFKPGRSLRFWRVDVETWARAHADEKKVFAPYKGKKSR